VNQITSTDVMGRLDVQLRLKFLDVGYVFMELCWERIGVMNKWVQC
jgi:hypothetical protein